MQADEVYDGQLAGLWYECPECPFQTNSGRNAVRHEEETGHKIAPMPDHNEEDPRT